MNMKKIFGFLGELVGLGIAVLLIWAVSNKVYAVTATATVDAKVLLTMSMANLRGMSFGAISASSTAGAVTIQPDGTVVASGGVTVGDSGTAGAASFRLSGEPSAAFTVQLPATVVLTDPSGNTMTVNTFQSDPSVTGQLAGDGSLVLSIGGSLQVGASQPPGDYSGLMSVAVNYN